MLSKTVSVTVFGRLTKNLYSGYINGEKINNKSAYIISKRPVFEFFNGTVIAVALLSNGEEKPIVACGSEIFYEPELRENLAYLKNEKIVKLSCLYEKSCGAIIFYKFKPKEYKFLLVKNHNSRHWSFPKGHIELGEKEIDTAVREVKEETGLDVRIVKNFREVADYCPFGKIRKHVVFFLAQSFVPDVIIQESEIDSYLWASPSQARRLCVYDNDHKVIDKAVDYIKIMRM